MLDPSWIAIDFAIGSSIVAVIVWLVRLEGRLNGQAGRLEALEKASDGHTAQREAMIRLEEQVKHLTALIERLDDRIAIALTPHAAPKPRQRPAQ
jgi:hypothetical protein